MAWTCQRSIWVNVSIVQHITELTGMASINLQPYYVNELLRND